MKIDSLKKVTLGITPHGPLPTSTPDMGAHSIDFIYGIGRDGLCPLESAIGGKGLGDTVSVPTEGMHWPHFFGHLYPLICGTLKLPEVSENQNLEISILAIVSPENREIVAALASSVGRGCSSDGCGCGCS